MNEPIRQNLEDQIIDAVAPHVVPHAIAIRKAKDRHAAGQPLTIQPIDDDVVDQTIDLHIAEAEQSIDLHADEYGATPDLTPALSLDSILNQLGEIDREPRRLLVSLTRDINQYAALKVNATDPFARYLAGMAELKLLEIQGTLIGRLHHDADVAGRIGGAS